MSLIEELASARKMKLSTINITRANTSETPASPRRGAKLRGCWPDRRAKPGHAYHVVTCIITVAFTVNCRVVWLVALNLTLKFPVAVGVPESTPVEPFKVSPSRFPLTTEYLRGPVG